MRKKLFQTTLVVLILCVTLTSCAGIRGEPSKGYVYNNLIYVDEQGDLAGLDIQELYITDKDFDKWGKNLLDGKLYCNYDQKLDYKFKDKKRELKVKFKTKELGEITKDVSLEGIDLTNFYIVIDKDIETGDIVIIPKDTKNVQDVITL